MEALPSAVVCAMSTHTSRMIGENGPPYHLNQNLERQTQFWFPDCQINFEVVFKSCGYICCFS